MKKIFTVFIFSTTITFFNSFKAQIFTEDFESTSDWTFIDGDGDTQNWKIIDLSTQVTPLASQGRVAHSFSLDPETFNALTPNNYLISPVLSFSGYSSVNLAYKIGAEAVAGEQYSVYATNDISLMNLASLTPLFTEVLSQSGQALYNRTVDLSSLAGQNGVYLVFRHHDVTNKWNVLLDDILVDGVQGSVNVAPTTIADQASTNFNTAVVIDVLANDSDDVSLDLSSVTITQQPANGTVSVNVTTGAITYTPNAGYSGVDGFAYQVCDNGTPALCSGNTLVGITVGVNSINEKSIVSSVYPNPVNNVLNVKTEELIKSIKIIDVDGKELLYNKALNSSSINVEFLTKGVYFLEINFENGITSRNQFVKN